MASDSAAGGAALFFALVTFFSFVVVSIIVYIKFKKFKDDTQAMQKTLDGRTASNDARHDSDITRVQNTIGDMGKSFSTNSLSVAGASFAYSNNIFTIQHPLSNISMQMKADGTFFNGPIETSNYIYSGLGVAAPAVYAEDVAGSYIGALEAIGAPLVVGYKGQIDALDAMNITASDITTSNITTNKLDIANKWTFSDTAGDQWLRVMSKDGTGGLATDSLLVNKSISAEGDVNVSSMLRVGRSATDKWPESLSNQVGGVHAYDVYANDSIAAGKDGDIAAYFNSSGSIVGQNISTASGVAITNPDPGPLIQKSYGTNGSRYGVGQFPSGTTRVYAGEEMTAASVNLGFSKSDGTFDDVIKVSKEGSTYKTSVTDGKLCVQDTCITKAALDKIVQSTGAAGL